MDAFDFNYLINQLLDKISKDQNQIFILEVFKINWLNYNKHQPNNEFLDLLALNSVLVYISQPTKLTSYCKTLIDNILSKFNFI